MSKMQESGSQYFYRVWVPRITSLGASIVVIGALYKIMHWEGAGIMLTVGLMTESFIFFIGTFQPAPASDFHYDWAKVYPELAEGDGGNRNKLSSKNEKQNKIMEAMAGIDKLLMEANIGADVFKNFGTGMKSLNDRVNDMKTVTSAASASNEYVQNLNSATKSVAELNKAYSVATSAMNEMSSSAKDAKEYHGQVQVLTKNLGALNAVYEMELKDANSHLKAMNKFYSNLTVAMESMTDASKESKQFKDQLSNLTTNISSLNKVYGNMLAAMKA